MYLFKQRDNRNGKKITWLLNEIQQQLRMEFLIIQKNDANGSTSYYYCEDSKYLLGGKNSFMVVQWLRLHAPNAGVSGRIPGQGTRSHMLQL